MGEQREHHEHHEHHEQHKKLFFIGAGVGNLVPILNLLKNGYPGHLITLIDKGKGKDRDKKDLLSGLAGAGLYSDAKWIFSKHKDQPVFEYSDKVESYYPIIKNLIKEFHPKPDSISISEPEELPPVLKENGVENSYKSGWGSIAIKQSTTYHVGSHYGKLISMGWLDYMISKNVNVYFETKFIDIKDGYIMTDKLNFKFSENDECYLALGKIGKKDLSNFYKKHNIAAKVTDMNLGVRFEIDYDNNKKLQEIVKNQYDFKFSKDIDKDTNIRTFCVCSGSAYVALENFNDTVRVNGEGYGINFKEKWTGNTNFGIMINKKINGDDIINGIIEKYPNGFMVTSGDRFLKTTEDLPIITMNTFMDLYGEYGGIIKDFIEDLDNIIGFTGVTGYRFYGPEIKEGASRVQLGKDLSIPQFGNVYSLGDSGIATRGLTPAAVSGLIATEHLLSNNQHNNKVNNES